MLHRIFVVEDHPVMREAYASLLAFEDDLEMCGAVGSAEEAFQIILDADPPCDLVVTDFRLPKASGADLTRRLGAARPALPVLVVSAHEEAAFVREARDAGAVSFLRKRDLVAALVPAIHAALAAPSAAADPAE